jgi:tRNA (cmo5U34)-methyltransferase
MNIKEKFDSYASAYDDDRHRLIPCYDHFYSIPIEIIPFHPERELRVLDLGAGTGILSAEIAKKFPRALLTLIDLSPKMLQIAEHRFAQLDTTRVTFQIKNYGKESLKGTYDLVVSALSIHHLTDTSKAKLFKTIHNVLEPGGLFINADQVLGDTPVAEKICSRTWLQKVIESGISETALNAALDRMKEDRMACLSNQLEWLREAGFVDITTWYRYYNFAVYSATKALPF